MLFYAILGYTRLCYTILYYTLLYYTILYYTKGHACTSPLALAWQLFGIRKGTNGVNTNGVTANFMFLIEVLFWYQSVNIWQNLSTYVNFSYRFPRSIKIHYLCCGPDSVDPICPQPRHPRGRDVRGPGAPGVPVHRHRLDLLPLRPEVSKEGQWGNKERQWVLRTLLHIRTLVFLCSAWF